ncbi:hypothetical protein ACOSQ2_001665 [Xanthoceras sorbifolium]
MDNTILNSTETIPAFKRKPEMGGAVQMRMKRRKMEEEEVVVHEKVEVSMSCSSSSSEEEEEEEKEEMERKIVALQRMVPGGEMLEVDKLFEETAGYILALQSQIKAMRVLATFIQGLEKEKRKFGG